MVVFACNSCGTSLKKGNVAAHIHGCRRGTTVSCMDCQKDFDSKTYSAHTKCISEAEKYGGENWKAPSNFNKGEKKQQAWVDIVNETLQLAGKNLSPPCKSLMQTLSKHDNVPRKKAKFLNFIQNIAKGRFDEFTIDNVWDLLEQQWKKNAEANKKPEQNVKQESGKENDDSKEDLENGTTVEETAEETVKKLSKRERKNARKQRQHKEEKKEKRNKSEESEDVPVPELKVEGDDTKKISKKEMKKRKREESETEHEQKKPKIEEEEEQNGFVDEEAASSPNDFRWGTIIKEVLMKQPDHEISIKKLKKKIFAEYYAVVGDTKGAKTQEELVSKLNKKLRKQQFKVFKDSVRLVE